MKKISLYKIGKYLLIFLPLIIILTSIFYIVIYINQPPELSYIHFNYEKYKNGNYSIDTILDNSNNNFLNINEINIDYFDKDTRIIVENRNIKMNNKIYKIYTFENKNILYYKIIKNNETIGYFEENFSKDTIILNIINNDNKILKIIFKKV